MTSITENVPRFGAMNGWVNRILRIDLSNMRIRAHESSQYVPEYLGARGIAAKICWDEYPEPVDPFAPANPIMIFPGALTGSRSPYSGRTNVCAFSPQAYPHHWFTRSSIGGHFGGELKRAGYDGVVITGATDTPVRILIYDDEVRILPSDDLWGLDIYESLEELESIEGNGVRSLVIGPTGELLSRIATIQTASSSACGQGGFGAVMGSKKLKAISVIGTGQVSLAQPDIIHSIAKGIAAEKRDNNLFCLGMNAREMNEQLVLEGGGTVSRRICTESCVSPCVAHFKDVPGVAYNRKWSGSWLCVAAFCLPGPGENASEEAKSAYDWRLDRRAAFEMNVLSNRYGLNQFDLLVGIVPWLIACNKRGLISEINGKPMDWRSPAFWAHFLKAAAYREGLGDTLAEGGWAASRALHLGEDVARSNYPGWGHVKHWDGHDPWTVLPFPHWLVSALQWMADTRDPFSTGHGSLWAPSAAGRAANLDSEGDTNATLDKIRAVGERLYHDSDSVDPYSGYKAKAFPGFFHTIRPVIKDCVPVDDLKLPMIWSEKSKDGFCRIKGVEGLGDIEGPSVEYHLFTAGTGVPWSEEEFNTAAARVCTLERALHVRHWGRDRKTDEMVLPFFELPEGGQSPFLKERYGLDRKAFKPVMDEFYRLHGWDAETGRPTEQGLADLDLSGVYKPMIEGASRAKENNPDKREA